MTVAILKKEFIPNRNGWDISINIEANGKKRFLVFHWPQIAEPDEIVLVDKFAYFENQLANEPEPEKSYLESEIIEILITKKYLKEGDKFDDLPVKQKELNELGFL